MADTQALSVDCYRCSDCGNTTLMVKKVCARCGGTNIIPTKSEGKGEVLDFTAVYYPPDSYKDMCPYTSILVRLSSGCKLFGVIPGEVKDIKAGTPVVLERNEAERGRLIFRLG